MSFMRESLFDLSAYKDAKKRISDMVKSSHQWETTEGFIDDGVISPGVYASQPFRILCVLAESYGYSDSGVIDIETQASDDVLGLGSSTVMTPRRLATFLWVLLNSVEQGRKVTLDEWRELPHFFEITAENTKMLQDALSKIAWINVKKASNGDGTKLDAQVAYTHAIRNKDILLEQVAAINPDLIFVCGETAFQSSLEIGLLGPSVVAGKKWQLQDGREGRVVAELTHPAYPADWAGYGDIYRNFEIIFDQLAARDELPRSESV